MEAGERRGSHDVGYGRQRLEPDDLDHLRRQGGHYRDTTVHFYYDNRWRILETRNGSNQPTRQWAWGTQYVDEPLFMDVNDSPTTSTSCAPDESDSDDDRRYFYHQDRNWNVVALTESDDGVGTDGRIVERYAYMPYGEFIVLKGDTGNGEMGNVLPTSSIGNPFAHQGLCRDRETQTDQQRKRQRQRGRFMRRDPVGHVAGMNLYVFAADNPVLLRDPSGGVPVLELPPITFSVCQLLTGGGPVGQTWPINLGWTNDISECTFSVSQDYGCSDCKRYRASATATGTPHGKIGVKYADVVPMPSCPDAYPPFDSASAAWWSAFASAAEACINEHEDGHVDIYQATYVTMTASESGSSCSKDFACSLAKSSASMALQIKQTNAKIWCQERHVYHDSQESRTKCITDWVRAHPPQ